MSIPIGSYENGFYEIKGSVSFGDQTDQTDLFCFDSLGEEDFVNISFSCTDNEPEGEKCWALCVCFEDADSLVQMTEHLFSQTGSDFCDIAQLHAEGCWGVAVVFLPSSETSVGTYTLRVNDTRIPISLAEITVPDQYYTGEPVAPPVTVKMGGKTLRGAHGSDESAEYTYYFSGPLTEPGLVRYTITGGAPYQNWVQGKDTYKGEVTGTFRIKPAPMSLTTISGLKDMQYTGSALKQSPKITYNGMTLEEGTDYTVAYRNNTDLGTATVTFTGKGHFTGSVSRTFRIYTDHPVSLSSASVTGIRSAVYAGSPVTQTPVVKLDGKTLKKGTDYTLSYKDNNQAGTATVTFTGKGLYTGTVSRTFTIKAGSGIITAGASKYTAYAGTTSSGKLKEGLAVSLLRKSGSRWKVKAGNTVCWVDGHYVFNTAAGTPKASDRVGQGVTTKTVTVYTQPAAGSSKIAVLKKGVLRNLYAQSGNWYQIYTGGRYGWVRVDGFDYTQSVSRGRLAQVWTLKRIQTYYGPGADYVRSIVIPANAPLNIYKKEGSWALVYRTGKFLWVRLTSSNAK